MASYCIKCNRRIAEGVKEWDIDAQSIPLRGRSMRTLIQKWMLYTWVLAGVATLMAAGQTTDRAQLVIQAGHINAVYSAVFSQEGRFVLTGGSDGTARLWDTGTGREIRVFRSTHLSYLRAVTFVPGSSLIVTSGSDNIARLWDSSSGREVRKFEGHAQSIVAVAVSQDGHFLLTGSKDMTTRLWSVETGREIRRFPAEGEVNTVSFSPDGRLAAVGAQKGGAVLWDLESGRELDRLQPWKEFTEIVSVSFANNGNYLVCASSKEVVTWERTTKRFIHKFAVDEEQTPIRAVALSTDGTLLLIGDMKFVSLWDVASGRVVQRFLGHTKQILSVAFSPDGSKALTASDDATVKLWDTRTGQLIHDLKGQVDGVSSVSFSPDGHSLLVGSWDNTAVIWNLANGKEVQRFVGHTEPVFSSIFSRDGRMVVTGSRDKTCRLWDVSTGKEIRKFTGHTDAIWSVAISPDGKRIFTGSDDKTVRLWNASTGLEIRRFASSESIGAIALSADGRTMAVADTYGYKVELWSPVSSRSPKKLEVKRGFLYYVGLSGKGNMVLMGDDNDAAVLRNAKSGQIVRSFRETQSWIASAALSLDNRWLLTGDDQGETQLWDVATGTLLRRLAGNQGRVDSVAFSPDASLIVTGGQDGTTILWNRSSGAALATIATSPTGSWVVVDAEGQFDTNDLDGSELLAWVANDDPMRALPLEIFMHDYYTPGLLNIMMKGDEGKLPKIRSIAEIDNRVQPDVSIVSVVSSSDMPERVDVMVHASSRFEVDKKQASGLQDLRLFRDGQMVGSAWVEAEEINALGQVEQKHVYGGYIRGLLKDGDYTFHDVLLKSDRKETTFTAYAFNSERIKSATTTFAYKPNVLSAKAAVSPRAFLFEIGVNHYTAEGCELNYAVGDAESMSAALTKRLRAQGYIVEPIKVESAVGANELAASKSIIREQLARIAAQATPDDVFFMSYSGHGYSSTGGEFYILPSDIQGSCREVDDRLLNTAISASELAEWLRPIDAGEMTLILDACFSAESVESGEFKPGPFGSRGLGQLAYDKRMRVLAASQSTEVAHEYEYLQEGLLTYVLTHDGLDKGEADWKPVDKKITLGEWLSYAADAVPKFRPNVAKSAVAKSVEIKSEFNSTKTSVQVPVLFDFSKMDTLTLQ